MYGVVRTSDLHLGEKRSEGTFAIARLHLEGDSGWLSVQPTSRLANTSPDDSPPCPATVTRGSTRVIRQFSGCFEIPNFPYLAEEIDEYLTIRTRLVSAIGNDENANLRGGHEPRTRKISPDHTDHTRRGVLNPS
jgi:hypothetical protein